MELKKHLSASATAAVDAPVVPLDAHAPASPVPSVRSVVPTDPKPEAIDVEAAAKDVEMKDIDGDHLSAEEDDGWSEVDNDELGTCTHSRQSHSLFGAPDGVAPRVSEDQISPPGDGAPAPAPSCQQVQAKARLQPPVASTAPRSLLPARPPVAKGAGKGKAAAAKPKALSKKDIPPGFKRCSTCLEALPESDFEDKRNVCKDYDLACESLQRVPRTKSEATITKEG